MKGMLMHKTVIATAWFLLAASIAGARADVLLVDEGRAAAVVMLSRNASSDEVSASRIIRDYMQRMSGARLRLRRPSRLALARQGARPRILILGPSVSTPDWPAIGVSPDRLKPQGFALLSDGRRNIVLAARDGAGIRYAAYTFLEKLGVRWFMPGELGEVVPRKRTVSVGAVQEIQSPDFIERKLWMGWSDRPPKVRQEYNLWCEHNKLGGPDLSIGHNLANIIPPSRYFAEHPEYFPLIDGKRTVSGDWQPCTSNPDVVRIASEAAIRFFDQHPGAVCFSLSPNDGYGWCMCDKCRALDPPQYRDRPRRGKARRVVIFANAVARQLAKKHPGKQVAFYAYAGTIEPPTDVKVEPNVIVGICHYGRVACFLHPIDDPDCPINSAFREVVDGWRKIADKLVAREYFTALWEPTSGPAGVARAFTLFHDIPWYRDRGFVGLNAQSEPAWGMFGLNHYITAKLAWDAALDPEQLLADYFTKFYGPAGAKMREYFEFMAHQAVSRAHSAQPILTDGDIARGARLLAEAHALARTDVQRKRIELSQGYLRYVQAVRRFASNPSEESWTQIQRVGESLKGSLAIDDRYHRYLYGGSYRPQLGGEGRYRGEALQPIDLGRPREQSFNVAFPLRGPHGLLIRADKGEDVQVRLSCEQLGSYYDPLTYELYGPSGGILARGAVGIGQTRDVQVAAEQTGICNLLVGAGSNCALVTAQNRYAVLRGRTLHFFGKVPRLFFFVPEGVNAFVILMRTESPGETGKLQIYNPEGRMVFVGDTTTTSVVRAPVNVGGDAAKAWSLEVAPASSGVCDDIFITLPSEIPPYLATAPERLLIPEG